MFSQFRQHTLPTWPFFHLLRQAQLADFPDILFSEIRFSLADFDPSLFAACGIPPPAHLSKAVKKRQAEYLASRYLAQQVMSHYGIGHFLLQNSRDRAPIWPLGIAASLSHTHHCAVLLSTDTDQLVGVDIEQLIAAEVAAGLQETLLVAAESQRLARSGLSFTQAITVAFSLKESLYKALYPHSQQFIGFHDAMVIEVDAVNGTACLQLTKNIGAAFPAGRQFNGYFQLRREEVITLVID
ncbi:4'-phosphopantetheinyl transferase superfamily protein [Paramixta manurensis]|uniref:Enterobactin synthase component D n=1 Tax=Paramixta manurensis TaxID=2740817 RepID=A0A6M8UAQ7_9GAMM|nr:4'-phosphopantetheinyl transferase superfamily protein [Erwiniaceae bacterium PD-1]